MKILTVTGTRPELIRLSRIINKLDNCCEHILLHTGQNFDPNLKDIFFSELGIRKPNYSFSIQKDNRFGGKVGDILSDIEWVLSKEKPDKVLILGDTTSGLASIVAERHQIPVFHMEAGNRCWDREVPEEINRYIIDRISSFNLPYTQRSKQNLLAEGYPLNKIFVTGNPIKEVIDYYSPQINSSPILSKLNLTPFNYFLCTFHRTECIENSNKLNQLLTGLDLVANYYNLPIIISTHPHTKLKLQSCNLNPLLKFISPVGFFDFIKLEKHSKCVLTDSGTVPEETSILGIPSVILRNSTERPEIIEAGSSILAGVDSQRILNCTKLICETPPSWDFPENYNKNNVSQTVVNILLGNF